MESASHCRNGQEAKTDKPLITSRRSSYSGIDAVLVPKDRGSATVRRGRRAAWALRGCAHRRVRSVASPARAKVDGREAGRGSSRARKSKYTLGAKAKCSAPLLEPRAVDQSTRHRHALGRSLAALCGLHLPPTTRYPNRVTQQRGVDWLLLRL